MVNWWGFSSDGPNFLEPSRVQHGAMNATDAAREQILHHWKVQMQAMDEADTDQLRQCFTPDAVLVHMTGYRPDGSGQAWPLDVRQDLVAADGEWLVAESRVRLG